MNMREYSAIQTSALLRRLSDQVIHAAHSADEEAVHDLRVVIRRLSRCLRVFARFYPGSSGKKLRGQLGDLMEAAGAVRDIDIALGLLSEAGLPHNAAIVVRLSDARLRNCRRLLAVIRCWNHRQFRKWSRKLELPL